SPAGSGPDIAPEDAGSGRRNARHFSNVFTAINPAAHEHAVASSAVPMMAEGFLDPLVASTVMAVTGISCTEPVLMTRKVHIALVAVPGNRLSESRPFIARNPSGVAALP